MTRIHLTIDRLVLRGLEPGQDKSFVESLRKQLTSALSDGSAHSAQLQTHHTPVLTLGRVPVQPGATGGAKLGKTVAQGIARGLKR